MKQCFKIVLWICTHTCFVDVAICMTAFTVTIWWKFYKNEIIVTIQRILKKAFQKLFCKIPTSGVEKPDFQMGFENLEILQFFEFHENPILTL